jgi:hypothetical protein
MKLKEILEQLKSYQSHHQVIAMTKDREKISTTFDLYTSPIHSNMFSIFGNIRHIGEEKYHFHVINNKNVILMLTGIPEHSTRRGYKGQEIDYVEPEEKELLFLNNQEQIIIQCRGK